MFQHWRELDKEEGELWPVGRGRHAATCLGVGDDPELLVTGGTDEKDKVLSDSWILNLQTGRWREVKLYSQTLMHVEMLGVLVLDYLGSSCAG